MKGKKAYWLGIFPAALGLAFHMIVCYGGWYAMFGAC